MKSKELIPCFAGICLACATGNAQTAPEHSRTPAASRPDEQKGLADAKWERLVMHPFHNSEGALTGELPLPASWKVTSNRLRGEPTIVGPNGLKVIDFPGQNFVYTRDPQLQQSFAWSGQRTRAMPGLEQLMQQDVAPWCASQGLRFVRQYELPEVAKLVEWYHDQLYQAIPAEARAFAVGTDWKHETGAQYFILLRGIVSEGGGMQTWYYEASGLQAEAEYFEAAKKRLLFGIANTRFRLEPIMTHNRREAEKAGRSWAEHNRRLAHNQAAFEASQRAFINRQNAVNDSIMSGWRQRNAAEDRAHERFIDTIAERSTVADPASGERLKVDSGFNHYWMNQEGRYLSTDNATYDPNLDEGLNRQTWRMLEKVD